MIAFWMLWATWVGALIVGVALVAERLLVAFGGGRRVAWSLALALATGVAVTGRLMTPDTTLAGRARSPDIHDGVGQYGAARPTMGLTPYRNATSRFRRALGDARDRLVRQLTPFDWILVCAWGLTSVALTVSTLRSDRALQRRRRTWSETRLEDIDVLVAPDTGPAVIGLRRPTIVVPKWLLTYDPPLRALVLRHEREHIAAHDPWLVAMARMLVVLLPWNVAVWWAFRRLQLTVEMDCDARVLRRSPDRRVYGLLLLAVADARARHGSGALTVATELTRFSERALDLERRMHAFNQSKRPGRSRTTVMTIAAATVAVVVACDTPQPLTPSGERLTVTALAHRGSTVNRDEIEAWLRDERVTMDSSTLEVFDEAAMKPSMGITRLPELLIDYAVANEHIRRAYARLAPGKPLSGSVVIEVDIDSEGRVLRLDAGDPGPLPDGVDAVVALTSDVVPKLLGFASRDTPPTPPALKRAAEEALRPLARFAPAELDGQPVPLRAFRMTFAFDQ